MFKLNLDTDMRGAHSFALAMTLRAYSDHAPSTLCAVSEGALHLSSEYLRLFAIELFHRSVEWAKIEQEDADAEREREGLAKSKELQLKVNSFHSISHLLHGS